MSTTVGSRFNRKMFQFQTHLHVKDKTKDFDLKSAKTRLLENKKLYKEILHNAEKLEIETFQPILTLKQTALLVNDVNIHQQLSMIDEIGFENITENLIIPLKQHIEHYDSIQRKIDECHTTRVDMDRHKQKLDSLLKKKGKRNENKIQDYQLKYNQESERYSQLREEIMEAFSHFEEERRIITRPIMSSLLLSYTTYLDNVYRSWGNIRRVMEEQPPYLPSSEINKQQKLSFNSNPTKQLSFKQENETQIAECIHEFIGGENELSLKIGDRVKIIEEDGDWFYGERKGKQGYFPVEYVRII